MHAEAETPFSRTLMLLGERRMLKLSQSRVCVLGLGGVGSYTAEALVRSGLGAIDIVDDDSVSVSNLNRQLYALHSTIGQSKVDAAENRILDINPLCRVKKHKIFFLPENAKQFNFSDYDYVADCTDTVTAKICIIRTAKAADVPVISCMGTGNKMNPLLFEIADISETSVCPVARIMRRELKKRGIENVKVLYSKEPPISLTPDTETAPDNETADNETPFDLEDENSNQGGVFAENRITKRIPGSTAFCPSVAGLIIASEIIKDLCS
ncbi:tRNA threonylcarbamoyladenosine dehydratase [Treponema parvum]|uniref:tRNA threonylcarbamoyladenosine dehydratase n=2 Tax=Treponema parvum TaxID=138851 RepID=A0A975F201_9SPIR|nr:tRNA threonylcarbamoyladenosine dehydratase [Treponema parvum]